MVDATYEIKRGAIMDLEPLVSEFFKNRKPAKILHLGCGRKKIPGTIGLDIRKFSEVDFCVDLNSKLPFGENSVDGVISNHVIEHLDYNNIMNEIMRVLKTGGINIMVVPHYTNHRAHMGEHVTPGFSWIAFEHFLDNKHPFNGFEILKNNVLFGKRLGLLGGIVNSNKKITYAYERFFSGILPASEIVVVMRKRSNAKFNLENKF